MKNKNILYGILFILAGSLILLNRLEIFGNINIINIALTIIFIVVSIYGFAEKKFYKALFPLAGICILYDKELGITSITPWTILLVTLFVSIGLSFIFKKNIVKKQNWKYQPNNSNNEYKVTFGGSVKYVTGEVDKIDLSSLCGSLEVYFDNAVFINGKLEIDVNINCGSVKIYIPKNCRITNNVSESLSNIDIKGKSNDIKCQDVILTGNLLMSSLEIIYV